MHHTVVTHSVSVFAGMCKYSSLKILSCDFSAADRYETFVAGGCWAVIEGGFQIDVQSEVIF